MTQLTTHHWSKQTVDLLEQSRQAIKESKTEGVRQLAERLPDSATHEKPISIVFAGQYSAGKSTIIKVLTGRDEIATGADITTDQAQDYEWNGIIVTDTPGIHTSLRPDHDAKSYQAISRADLLVFVITNELFDNHIAENYRKLTIEHEKAYESILVINKMGRHAEGNTPESQAIIPQDLLAPLQPFTPEELKVTFIDAASALEALEEDDPEFKEMLTQQANIETLTENMNRLVQERGIASRHTTILYTIDQVLQEAIAAEPTDDPQLDALNLVYNQNIRAMTQARNQIEQRIKTAIATTRERICATGQTLAENIHTEAVEQDLEIATELAETEVQKATETLAEDILEAIQDVLPELNVSIEDMSQSDLQTTTLEGLDLRSDRDRWSKNVQTLRSITAMLGDPARRFAFNQSAVATGATGLARFSGSVGHSTVLNIGHFLGHTFRPWEAIKLTRAIGRATPILSIATVALGLFLDIKQEVDGSNKLNRLREDRQKVRATFAQIGEEVASTAHSKAEATLQELLGDPLETIFLQKRRIKPTPSGK